MHAKLLLDENLSPRVAKALCTDGIDAAHVRDRASLGASDAEVLEKAFREDRVLVTVNVADFVKLARARELHAGIVLIEDGALLVLEQLSWRPALGAGLHQPTLLIMSVERFRIGGAASHVRTWLRFSFVFIRDTRRAGSQDSARLRA